MKYQSTHEEKLLEIASPIENIIITSHISPDGDAVASTLGIYHWFKKHLPEKNVRVLLPGEEDPGFDFLIHSDVIEWNKELTEELKPEDLLLLVDGNALDRFTRKSDNIDLKEYVTFCVDHHEGASTNFDYSLIETNAASCCELIAKYFFTDNELEDKELGTLFMRGILGDTGGFKFVDQHNSDVLTQTKRIVDLGKIRIEDISRHMGLLSENEFEIIKDLMINAKNHAPKNMPKLTYSYISDEVIEKNSVLEATNATDEFMKNFLREIKDHPWGFTVRKRETEYKISFRSTPGGPDVQKLTKNYFNGGGHNLAAGGSFTLEEVESVEKAVEKILNTLDNCEFEIVEQD